MSVYITTVCEYMTVNVSLNSELARRLGIKSWRVAEEEPSLAEGSGSPCDVDHPSDRPWNEKNAQKRNHFVSIIECLSMLTLLLVHGF
jgi:hypothetical protein